MFRHPFHTAVNGIGLSVGIACCLLVSLFVRDEWSYDRFHGDAERILRIAHFEHIDNRDIVSAETAFPIAALFKDNIPEIEETVRLLGVRDQVRRDNTIISERIYMADRSFFEMFNFPLVHGQPNQVLGEIHNLVLSDSAAFKWFGSENPLGESLTLNVGNEPENYVVSGIFKSMPANSSIRCDYLIPLENAKARWSEEERQNLHNTFLETYIKLRNGADFAGINSKVPRIIRQAMGERYIPGAYVPRLQPLTEIHLDTSIPAGSQDTSDPAYSCILSLIAAFVLAIACINFVTLTLSRSTERSREVGVRKTLGALRGQIAVQFWGETLLQCGFAVVAGVVFAGMALPTFNDLAGKELVFRVDGFTIAVLLALLVTVGVLAGSYPALLLSRYHAAEALHGGLVFGDARLLRKILTTVQFTLAIVLILSTLIMRDQLVFLQQKNLGYNRELVVTVPTGLRRPAGLDLLQRMRNMLDERPAITGVTAMLFDFGEPWISAGYKGTDGVYREFRLNLVDFDFLKTLQIPLVAGRDFSREFGADLSQAVIINRAFADLHGWTDPIGKSLPGRGFQPHQIIGMVDDFNYASLRSSVEPLAIALSPLPLYDGLGMSYFAVPQPKLLFRIKPGNVFESLKQIGSAWKSAAEGIPFDYTFLDEMIQRQYAHEQHSSRIVGLATSLVVLLACLGLFGLTSLMVVKRTKEIGVRKVLGASVSGIVMLLAKDVVIMLAIAFAVATPVATMIMHQWLQNYAYATAIKLSTFGLAGAVIVLLAFFAVSYHSFRAATANPVEALRYE
jgi:putative ABC transport system permease protein